MGYRQRKDDIQRQMVGFLWSVALGNREQEQKCNDDTKGSYDAEWTEVIRNRLSRPKIYSLTAREENLKARTAPPNHVSHPATTGSDQSSKICQDRCGKAIISGKSLSRVSYHIVEQLKNVASRLMYGAQNSASLLCEHFNRLHNVEGCKAIQT